MNRLGARHVGEPRVLADKADRQACLYAAAMVTRHAPAFAGMAHQFEVMFRPPATIVLARPGDPDGQAILYTIPARLLPAASPAPPRQTDLEDGLAEVDDG